MAHPFSHITLLPLFRACPAPVGVYSELRIYSGFTKEGWKAGQEPGPLLLRSPPGRFSFYAENAQDGRIGSTPVRFPMV